MAQTLKHEDQVIQRVRKLVGSEAYVSFVTKRDISSARGESRTIENEFRLYVSAHTNEFCETAGDFRFSENADSIEGLLAKFADSWKKHQAGPPKGLPAASPDTRTGGKS